jgi:4a-hydroxytetrahydrobiopterin dehydratase
MPATLIDPKELAAKKCAACEGDLEKFNSDQVQTYLNSLPDWHLTDEGKRIRKDWKMKDFMAGITFFNRVAEIAEAEGHHPDLHLEGYRNVWIELWTHSLGGLSENDVIMAAKIDSLEA